MSGSASAQRVRESLAVMIYLAFKCLVGGLIGPMKSSVHFSKACNARTGCSGNSSLNDDFPTR
jgi:hypothetical protein